MVIFCILQLLQEGEKKRKYVKSLNFGLLKPQKDTTKTNYGPPSKEKIDLITEKSGLTTTIRKSDNLFGL
jgi:hypothetical protein